MWLTAPGSYWFVVLTAVIPYALITYLVGGVGFALLVRRADPVLRRWYAGAALLGLAGAVLHAGLMLPAFTGDHAGGRPDLTVMTLNLRKGEADPGEVVDLVRAHAVDVLVLEEVTPSARAALEQEGLSATLPEHAGQDADGASGTMVFSAYGLDAERQIASRQGAWIVRVQAPEPFVLVAVHTSQPLEEPDAWTKDWRAVDDAVVPLTGDRLVVGDFNATLDHRPVRRLLDAGLTDAAQRANSGWRPTWPSLGGIGLITIDHVLFSAAFDAISTSTPRVGGTDHRALIADLAR